MQDSGATTALAALIAADPDVLDRDGIGCLFGHARKLRGWLDATDVRLARRIKTLAAVDRSESVGSILTEESGRSGKHAKSTEDREELCAAMPGFEAALAAGDVTSDHLDALNQATRNLSEAELAEFNTHQHELVDEASNDYVSGFARRCKNLANRIQHTHRPTADEELLEQQRAASKVSNWVDRDTGMHKTLLQLDPIRHASLWKLIDAETARLKQIDGNSKTPYAQLQVEAFLNIQTGNRTGDRGNRVPEISVLIDLATLIGGRHPDSLSETEDGHPVPISTIRRLACEADIIPIVLGGDGEVLDVGKSERTATRTQRRALRAIYQTCAHPHCTIAYSQCRIHHIIWWHNNGRTDINNLLPLCEQHHHQVHEGGWQLTLTNTPERTLTWHRPDGTVWHTAPSPNRTTADTGTGTVSGTDTTDTSTTVRSKTGTADAGTGGTDTRETGTARTGTARTGTAQAGTGKNPERPDATAAGATGPANCVDRRSQEHGAPDSRASDQPSRLKFEQHDPPQHDRTPPAPAAAAPQTGSPVPEHHQPRLC